MKSQVISISLKGIVFLLLIFNNPIIKAHPVKSKSVFSNSLEIHALPPMTYTVTSTADTGAGTLNEAIANSNANVGIDIIEFNIAGVGPHTISLTSILPQITEAVYIDGETQSSTVIGDLVNGIPHQLQIDIVNGAAITDGIRVSSTGSGTTIRGLGIGGFTDYGIEVDANADNIVLEAVVVGTNIGGTAANANDIGVIFWDTNNTEVRNSLISGNSTDGLVFRNGSDANHIYQNLIGVNMNGTAGISNGDHNIFVRESGENNMIGGTDFTFRNVLSGSKWGAHYWAGNNNELSYNYIGTDITGTNIIGNTEAGLEVCGGNDGIVQNNVFGGNENCGIMLWGGSLERWTITDNIIGTDIGLTEDMGNGAAGICIYDSVDCTTIEGNTIVNSYASGSSSNLNLTGANGAGIWLRETASETFITQNTIYNNASLGIDIGTNGTPDLNDDGDGDSGPNNLLNFPVIESVYVSGFDLCIDGWTSAGTMVEFFIADSDASDFGEGQTFLFSAIEGSGDDSDATQSTYGPAAINTILQGTYTNENRFTFCETLTDLPAIPAGSDNITATASITSGTCADGFTSEFSGKAAMICSIPSNISAFAIQASCTNGSHNNDAYLQISAVTNGDRVNYSMGSTYAEDGGDGAGDTDYADADDISLATFPYIIANNLDNPTATGSQDYTIRIFNGTDNCYTDITVTLEEQDCVTSCSCDDYLYLNDPQGGGGNGFVHKFKINGDGSMTEIFRDPPNNTTPWFPSGGGLSNPHGLGQDINGFLYIGETSGGSIRRLTCDGEIIPEIDFVINDGGFNFDSKDGILYVPNGLDNRINAYSLCDGSLLGYIELNGIPTMGSYASDPLIDWGFEIAADGTFYVSSGWNDYDWDEGTSVYRFTPSLADFTAHTAYNPIITEADFPAGITDFTEVYGVTSDPSGNIYVLVLDYSNTAYTGPFVNWILKFDNTGTLDSSVSTTEDFVINGSNDGYGFGRGIVYYEPLDRLFIAAGPWGDCIAAVDAETLNYLGDVAANVPDQDPKGLALVAECCPTNNNLTIDKTLCAASLNDQLFLQELINCDGIVCEGIWEADAGNSGLIYDPCDNTVTIDALNACGSFTLESDGTGNNPQCGAFVITVNIEVEDISNNTISADQSVCGNETPAVLTSNATSSSGTISYQWQSSRNDCSYGFTDIAGANSSTYQPPVLTETTYYRLITSVGGTCSSGSCSDISDCVTLTYSNPILDLKVVCNSGANNDIDLSILEGISPYTYNWSNGSSNEDLTSIANGTYTVTITDANNCTATGMITTHLLDGVVFEDFNYNGEEDNGEVGIEGVEVQIYDCDNDLVATVYTDSNGYWGLTSGITAGENYRVEFVLPANIAAWASSTQTGTNNGTMVQFVQPDECTSLGLASPADYCQENPLLAVPCYVNGDPTGGGTAGTIDWLVYFRNNNQGEVGEVGHTAPETKVGGTVIGATWGVAYHQQTQNVLASAVMKRHSGFGQNGTGAIYQIDAAGVPSLFVDLNSYINVNTGADTRGGDANNTLPANFNVANRDLDAFQAVGKIGLGDIDFSDDGKHLYAINLNEKTLVELEVGNTLTAPATATVYDLISGTGINCGTASDYRPWALKYHKGLLYIGVICSAESSQTASDLQAYVFSFDPSNPGSGFSQVLNMPMDYDREPAFQSDVSSQTISGIWRPWAEDYTDATILSWNGAAHPSPILADLEFDVDGSLILGFMDRFGMQSGYRQLSTNLGDSNTDHQGLSAGDIIRFCNVNGTLIREGEGGCPFNTSPLWVNPGDFVPRGEFYANDEFFTTITNPSHGHPETGLGSLALLAGSGEVTVGVMDPFALRSGGIAWWNNTDGSVNKEYELYESVDGDGSFSKAVGLGDLEYMCNAAPLEIGNYVWEDTNGDGIQGACENPIENVILTLYNSACEIVAIDTTDAKGEYYFNAAKLTEYIAQADTALAIESTYYIVVSGAVGGTWTSSNSVLNIGSDNYNLTLANQGSRDGIDSDGEIGTPSSDCSGVSNGYIFTEVVTGNAGEVNHTFDFGLEPIVCPTNNCGRVNVTRN